jgi:simple sugar transport system ATP-binding protein
MIGAEPPALQPTTRAPGALMLQLEHMSLSALDPHGVSLLDLNLQVHAGEIVGVAGVSGNGQQEWMAALSGEDPRAKAASIRLRGQPIGTLRPRQRRALGLHFVPEERLGRGAVPSLPLALNTLLTRDELFGRGGWISPKRIAQVARELIQRYQVKAAGPQAAAQSLSGGNLQKFIMGREMDAQPSLLIVSQPTWGVDVGAAAQIRAALLSLREQGCAILLVSEELDELFALSDRLVVMARGRLSPSVPTASATVEQIGQWMSGLWPQPGTKAPEISQATHAEI